MTVHNPVASFILPHMPHPLLVPEKNAGYQRLRDAYEAVRQEIERIDPELLLIYSTKWPNVVGHQIQTRAEPEWVHVDEEWHELGSIPYKFKMDVDFGETYVETGRARGLEMRTVDYHGFPIDTGTVVALKLLNPDNKVPASVVSCNMYADRSETIVLGKAARDAVEQTGKRTVAIAITNLSNRIRHDIIPFEEDGIHSRKDDEWNRKYLEFLEGGRLEDASQLARSFSNQANGDQRMKAIWWLAALMGQTNDYEGTLFAYEGVYGCGCAVVGLTPSAAPAADLEFDEDDAETYDGDRNVLAAHGETNQNGAAVDEDNVERIVQPTMKIGVPDSRVAMPDPTPTGHGQRHGQPQDQLQDQQPSQSHGQSQDQPHGQPQAQGVVVATKAPKPVGAYPHARRVGDLLFLSGLGPRNPEDNSIPGGPVREADGSPREYDVRAQTEAVIENMKTVLAASGLGLEDVVDCTCFLINMDRDFQGFNEVYKKHFEPVGATRTTLEIDALPTPIAVEFKAIAAFPKE